MPGRHGQSGNEWVPSVVVGSDAQLPAKLGHFPPVPPEDQALQPIDDARGQREEADQVIVAFRPAILLRIVRPYSTRGFGKDGHT
jgi:hypothetical protein